MVKNEKVTHVWLKVQPDNQGDSHFSDIKACDRLNFQVDGNHVDEFFLEFGRLWFRLFLFQLAFLHPLSLLLLSALLLLSFLYSDNGSG